MPASLNGRRLAALVLLALNGGRQMSAQRRERALVAGARVRDKTNGRTGRIAAISTAGRRDQCTVAYDEAPQDRYITTPVTEGVQRPKAVLEPVL